MNIRAKSILLLFGVLFFISCINVVPVAAVDETTEYIEYEYTAIETWYPFPDNYDIWYKTKLVTKVTFRHVEGGYWDRRTGMYQYYEKWYVHELEHTMWEKDDICPTVWSRYCSYYYLRIYDAGTTNQRWSTEGTYSVYWDGDSQIHNPNHQVNGPASIDIEWITFTDCGSIFIQKSVYHGASTPYWSSTKLN